MLVDEVERASEAAQKGLEPGDIIIEINQKPVDTPSTVNNVVTQSLKDKRSSVLLLINRNDNVRFVALKLKHEEKK